MVMVEEKREDMRGKRCVAVMRISWQDEACPEMARSRDSVRIT